MNCGNRDCGEQERHDFAMAIVNIREQLEPIKTGMITRGRRVSQYDLRYGTRKTTLKDARAIATLAIERINIAVNKYFSV